MKELNQFETYLIHEFVEDYEDGLVSRRDMVRRVLHITGGVATTATLLSRLGVTPVGAQEGTPPPQPTPTGPRSTVSVLADDPRVQAEDITFEGNGATIRAYQARASGAATPGAGAGATPMTGAGGGLPVVLICHANRGLTEHFRDVTRRWAAQGYVACAVDPSQIPALLTRETDPAQHVGDLQAAAAHYATQDFADASRLAMTGFCFGGGITWRAATRMPELKAAAPYYGPPPPLDQVPNIRAAVLGVYSDDPDDFANEGRTELEEALEAAGVTYEIKVYPNTQHGFHEDTSPRWNEEQALAAWNDTVAWFATHLQG